MIRDRCIYDPALPEDGYRVLVMRLVRDKSILEQRKFDIWMRALGPASDSLQRWWRGEIDDAQFIAEYGRDLSLPAMARLRRLELRHGTVTVLCKEQFPQTCHRYELVRLYHERYPCSEKATE